MKSIKARLRIVWQAVKLACSNPGQPITDSAIVVQWRVKNRCFIVGRSINTMMGLLLGQVIILKNGKQGLRANNAQFIKWMSSCVEGGLKRNKTNTPPYDHLHVRKVKMRLKRKYR